MPSLTQFIERNIGFFASYDCKSDSDSSGLKHLILRICHQVKQLEIVDVLSLKTAGKEFKGLFAELQAKATPDISEQAHELFDRFLKTISELQKGLTNGGVCVDCQGTGTWFAGASGKVQEKLLSIIPRAINDITENLRAPTTHCYSP
jgi:hypothetical protein